MGLDIRSYSKLENKGMPQGYESEDFDIWEIVNIDDDSFIFYNDGSNSYSVEYKLADGGSRFGIDRCDDLYPGLYHESHETCSHSFSAGSYGCYNDFRRDICLCVNGVHPQEIWENPDKWRKSPLFELINFSDCEGRIGPEVCKKLLNEMKENYLNFIKFLVDSYSEYDIHSIEYYKIRYENFIKCFEIASENGVVIFS
jgi:hypothetical protein